MERKGVNDLKRYLSGMFLFTGLSLLALGGCYEKPAETPKAPAEAPKAPEAAAPATAAPGSAAPEAPAATAPAK